MTDSLDHMGPDELIEEASQSLLIALAKLDGIRRALHEDWDSPPGQEPSNVVLLSAHRPHRPARPVPPSPGGRGGDGSGGQGVRGPRKVE